MVKQNISKKIARLHAAYAEIASLGPFMRGSVVRLGPRKTAMLSLNKNGKTKLVYLGESRIEQARQYSENYKHLLDLSEEITLLLMDLIKASVPHEIIWPPTRATQNPVTHHPKTRL